MREELKPCPFCGGEATRITLTDADGSENVGGDVICCTRCSASSHVEFGRKENLVSAWNTRAPNEALTERADMAAEIERLRADVARLREPHWFYLGDDCSSDQCRFGIDECISEDFEWDNQPKGNHVLQISGARPVPDMWVALHYFTEEEMDQRGDDEPYTYTVHTTEEDARAALEARP